VPLLAIHELPGFAVGLAAATLAGLAVRLVYLARLFPAMSIVRHVARALAPTAPAVAAVLLGRVLVDGSSAGRLVLELGGYVVIVALLTWALERPLMREAVGYVRRRSASPPPVAAAP